MGMGFCDSSVCYDMDAVHYVYKKAGQFDQIASDFKKKIGGVDS